MEVKFLSWNINKKPAQFISKIKKIITNIDILLLIENTQVSDSVIEQELGLKRLNSKININETEFTPKFYSKFDENEFEFVGISVSKRLVFTSLKFYNTEEVIICGIHFPSKKNYNELQQLEIAKEYVLEIEDLEKIKSNTKTLIFGDFNMNPYELGMSEYSAFNATLSEFEAKKKIKEFHYKKYSYFYNPMWSFLGDRNHLTGEKKIPGSYYYNQKPYWNIFDKVIMRPDIIDFFDFSSLKLIENLGDEKIVNDNFFIDTNEYSDHLPLSFKIKLQKI